MSRASRTLALALLVVLPLAGAGVASAQGSPVSAWRMTGCHGAATLALAPLADVQATLPSGFTAQDAATFVLPGGAAATTLLGPLEAGRYGLVGVEVWKCDQIALGDVRASGATYGSSAAVVERPDGAPAASLYFYKYENYVSTTSLEAQSERLGAPAELVTASSVTHTLAGAKGELTLANGARYAVSTTDLGDMGPGNFEEWHRGEKGLSRWFADFTIAPGKQGTGDVTVPAGSTAAAAMGGATSGSGLGIHTKSAFTGGVELTR